MPAGNRQRRAEPLRRTDQHLDDKGRDKITWKVFAPEAHRRRRRGIAYFELLLVLTSSRSST
jgi:hypothetical protein